MDFLSKFLADQGIDLGSKIGVTPMNVPQNEFQAGQAPVAPTAMPKAQPPAPVGQPGPSQGPEMSQPPTGGEPGAPDIMGIMKGANAALPGIMQSIGNISSNPGGVLNALSGSIGQGFQNAGLGNPGNLLQQMGAPPMEGLGQSISNNAQQAAAPLAPAPDNGFKNPAPVDPNAKDPEGFPGFSQFQANISRQESSNNYGAVNKQSGALGRYQVMPYNVGNWSKQYYGQTLTPQQFLHNPTAQDKVFSGYTQDQYKKYGNWGDVSSVWFTGRPASQGRHRSDGNMTGQQYINNATRGIGQQNPNPSVSPLNIPQNNNQGNMQNPNGGLGSLFGNGGGMGLIGNIAGGLSSLFGG